MPVRNDLMCDCHGPGVRASSRRPIPEHRIVRDVADRGGCSSVCDAVLLATTPEEITLVIVSSNYFGLSHLPRTTLDHPVDNGDKSDVRDLDIGQGLAYRKSRHLRELLRPV